MSAAQDVRDRVATVVRDLPRDTDPPTIAKSDTDPSPILTIALSGNRSQRELTEIADKIVKTQIERSAGVGEVEIVGGLERAINVWVDADRLAAYQIPITAVRDAWRGRTPTSPAATSPTARARKPAHDGPASGRARVQRPGDRDAQRLAHPRAGHRLGGGRQRRSSGPFPGSTARRRWRWRSCASPAPTRWRSSKA